MFQVRLVSDGANSETTELPVIGLSEEKPSGNELVHLEKEVLMDGTAIRWVSASSDRHTGMAALHLRFTEEGAVRLGELTAQHIGRRMALLLNGKVIIAPLIQQPIREGRAVIAGDFSSAEASAAAREVNFEIFAAENPPVRPLPELKQQSFTFVRVQYDSPRGRPSWSTDYPDADANFSRRLQEVTGIKCDPDGEILRLTDPELGKHPFIYMAEGGNLRLADAEAAALGDYLREGGFLMVDDFWGEDEWKGLAAELKKAFPEGRIVELALEHPVFNCFYEVKEKPQVPNVGTGIQSKFDGVTWERHDAKEAHYRGLIDPGGRMVAVLCHNTDFGDGWEREGVDEYYFKEFSLKKAYPMGINIVVYTLSRE